VLGRSPTLQDKATDIEYPSDVGLLDDGMDGTPSPSGARHSRPQRHRPRRHAAPPTGRRAHVSTDPYAAACYFFPFDRIMAEIKLMQCLAMRSLRRFPWPADLAAWHGRHAVRREGPPGVTFSLAYPVSVWLRVDFRDGSVGSSMCSGKVSIALW
jgi:hypothetical protein